ncbi:hypothetical protein [Agrobacterium pusense]|uniref:hypothetical protein n=1 Tax=Agrobacterium pusense TaxID=648995 RepID=UPI000D348F8C|nr:hypothetical protein [Agrobacterium pusense]PTV70252.1 hypothetical protein DBL06_25650 [Agrobacterium pusense]
MTSPNHAKTALADSLRDMSGTYTSKDIYAIAHIARSLKTPTAEGVHGYFMEDGSTVVFTGTDGTISYELRIHDQSAEPIQKPEPEVEQHAKVLPFPVRTKPPAAIPIAIPDSVMDELEAVLQREIENRRNPNVEN